MSEDSDSQTEEERPIFRPFTRESLAQIEARIQEENEKKRELEKKRAEGEVRYDDDDDDDGPIPDPALEGGMPIPIRLAAEFPPELVATPIEDIDPYYADKKTFIVISKGKDIFRFSGEDAVWALSPFSPVRRVAIHILVHPLFSLIIITTILLNCFMMIMPSSAKIESSEVIFTAIYTFESATKVMGRGFILEPFTYLRDAWNWLDFIVITLAYITMGIDLGNLAALRTFRVLRALKTVAIIPGLKTIVGAVIESVKNLRDVIILTVFALSVFALLGLQIYMGVLTQKCIRNFPEELVEKYMYQSNASIDQFHQAWAQFNENSSNWFWLEGAAHPVLCGNATGAGTCPDNYTCYQGFGRNPNYGYTSFDTFAWSFLSAFRLMTQDMWEELYQSVLRTAGSWHIIFFLVIIFLGSFYLVNLILAIVAMSYDELQKKAEEEEEAALAEEEALREAEEAAAMEEQKFTQGDEGLDVVDEADEDEIKMSPPDNRSEQSYELFVKHPPDRGETKDQLSVFSEEPDDNISDSDYEANNGRTNSRLRHRREVEGRTTSDTVANGHLDEDPEDDHEDDILSNGGFKSKLGLSPSIGGGSYTSQRSFRKPSNHSNPFLDPSQRQSVVDMKDVMVLNDIINQAASRGGSQDTRRTSRKISMFLTSDVEDEGPNFKERLVAAAYRFIDIFCVWDCCNAYIRLAEFLSFIIFDPFIDLFITLCILVNTLFMALDQHDMDPSLNETLKQGNYFFTATFAIEAVIKLLAMSPKYYFQEGWNIFDFIIVALSLIELGLASISGLSVLRSFRLLRVFKLAKSWPTLNLLISIMGKTVGALGNLTLVLGIIIFIFAVMGMQLFGKSYEDNIDRFQTKEMPRWNFVDFMHSFMIVFRVLCGEWIESMWDCMWVASKVCVPFFLATVVIGNLVVLNLFLALLLSSFGASNLSSAGAVDDDTNKLSEAFNRMGRFRRWVTRGILRGLVYVRDKIIQCCRNQINSRRIVPPEPNDPQRDWDSNLRRGWDSNDINEDTSVTDGLMRKMEDEQRLDDDQAMTQFDVKIGVGMDIAIHGENGDVGNEDWRTALHNHKRTVSNRNGGFIAPSHDFELIPFDELSLSSYGSHKNRTFNVGSHKGSLHSFNGAVENGLITKASAPMRSVMIDDEHIETKSISDMGDPADAQARIEAEILEATTQELMMQEYPAECCPDKCYIRFPFLAGDHDSPFWQGWGALRIKTFRLIENKYFETAVITMILVSSLALALEDVHLKNRPVLQDVLYYMDRIFTVIFFLEMCVKWLALGFVKYFTNAWCWLDFVIVMLSLMNLVGAAFGLSEMPAFRVLRTLRAIRPLRAMSRLQGMKVVVNALVQAIPSIFNVLMVCLIFWLIFAIMGVQMFAGKYYKCLDSEGNVMNANVIPDREACQAREDLTWANSKINFDNVPNGYLALFQVATFKGWMTILYDAVDSRELGQQPIREVNIYMYLYFVFFIILGSFFTLNLFIGVIIDNFNEQKKKAGGSLEMFMTDDQKKYYAAMKKMGNKKPVKAIPRPRWKPQAIVFGIVTNKKFDMIIMLFIALNMLTMTLDHYGQSEMWSFALDNLNMGFIVIFTSECVLKIFALRQYYFKEPWNVFDFVVVILSILGIVLSDLIEKYFVSPTLLRVVRVAKIGRVLRLVKGARGIRTLLFALAMSIPALFNICLLLFLVMFIFAIFGMSFFMNVKHRGTLDSVYNFETFGQSMILLFQMSTSAGWDGVLNGLMNEEDCQKDNPETGVAGNCGNSGMAIGFLLCYLVISFLIIINMYIAVILENYSQATEDVQEGLTGDDYDMYYEIWQQFDPDGTQYLKYNALSDFLDVLEPPLQIHKPNKYKIISMDIPICKGDLCYCVDVLDALTKDFFARKGNPVEETAELGEVTAHTDRPGYEPISSTLWRQREDYCARLIQHAWKRRGAPGEDGEEQEGLFYDNPRGTEEDSDESEDEAIPPHVPPERRPLTTTSLTRRRNNTSGLSQPSVEAVDVVVHSRSSSVSSITTANGGNRMFDV